MKRVTQLLKAIGILLLIAVAGFSAFFLIGISVMGDRNCTIQIKNEGRGQLILKTFQYTRYDKKLTVDSIVLSPNEKIKIGQCINCSTPDTMDINFDAIAIYDNELKSKLMYKTDLIKYLETKDKEDCVTYILR
jgi:hypothetical protein